VEITFKMNQFHTLRTVILTLVMTLFSGVGQAQSSMEPILPLQFGSAKEVPLVEETMRDPKIEENSVHSAEEASARRDRARTIENQLEIDSKINRRDSYLSLVELYASIAYYYTDGFDGKQDLNEARTAQIAVIKYADLLANSSNKKTAEFARASYIVHTTRYLIGSTRDSSIKNLRFLIDKSKLNLALKRRAEFLVNVWDVEHGRSQELAKLKRSIGSLPKTGAIAARLAIARYEAGINPSGNKSGATRSTYKGFLATAAKRSSTLQRSQSQKVLSFSLAIWRTAEGTRSPWAKPPFNLAAYSEFLETVLSRSGRLSIVGLRARTQLQSVRIKIFRSLFLVKSKWMTWIVEY